MDFNWNENDLSRAGGFYGKRHETCIGNKLTKVPMKQMVVDEHGQVWEYSFGEKGLVFLYICSCATEII